MQNNMSTECTEFDPIQWRIKCAEIANDAQKRCASSYEYFVRLFSNDIDGEIKKLPEEHHFQAVTIAQEWDYCTAEDLAKLVEELADQGCCLHGIEWECCPAGCSAARSFTAGD